MTAVEAGDLLSVPPTWLLAQARQGRVPHVRLGRYVRFDRDELLKWVREERSFGPSPE